MSAAWVRAVGDPAVLSGERLVAGFARALRAEGVDVPTGSVVTYAQALAHVGLAGPDHVYWAGRATLVRRPEDIAGYDRAWDAFWLERPAGPAPVVVPREVTLALDAGGDDDEPGAAEEPAGDVQAVRFSARETLRDRDFAALSAQEWAEAAQLLARLRLAADLRPGRRYHPSRQRRRADLRATLRGSLRHGGEPVDRRWRAPLQRPRRVVLILDVSGSMDTYARALLRFAQAAVAARGPRRVEVFALATRLTRLSRELAQHDPEAALAAAAQRGQDWSGGTRLGEGLRTFNDRWGVRGMARGAVVVICSDGWDRGDPDVLGAQMARLARVAHRVVWVNPLKASPGYAPLARGMAAALPWVDQFVEGHSLSALERLAAIVGSARRESP